MAIPAYDDATLAYDATTHVYDGIALRASGLTLIVGSLDRTDELGDEELSVHTATHGNSLGTLDAALDDPSPIPTTEEGVALYLGSDPLFQGWVRTVDALEREDGSIGVDIGCQDAGPAGGLPTAAPFGLTDDPLAEPADVEYATIARRTRTTEGGSPKTTYEITLEADGLRSGMNVQVTSAAFGLTNTELEIVEMEMRRRYADQPQYRLVLGDPAVHLAQVVREAEVPDGSITETKISDGAISTPKLAADAVIANVANIADTVLINAAGLSVTGGAVTVAGPDGTVIVDGTSNMFKIQATGTQSVGPIASGSDDYATTDLSGLGRQETTPACLFWVGDGNAIGSNQHPARFVAYTHAPGGGELDLEYIGQSSVRLTDDANDYVRVILFGSNESGSNRSFYQRWYVLKETIL